MDQDELFHEDFRDSLRHVIKALGGFEAVGVELWPTKARKAAGAWLSDCINPERPAKLDLEDMVGLLRMARDRGIHCAMSHLCDDLGYARPATVEPEDQEAEIARQADHRIEELTALVQRLERLRRVEDVRHLATARR